MISSIPCSRSRLPPHRGSRGSRRRPRTCFQPHRSSVTSSTRCTDTPARYISMRDSSGRFPAPAALYDGCLERGQAQFRDGDIELSRTPDERFQVVLESGFVDLPHAPLSGICERKYTLPCAMTLSATIFFRSQPFWSNFIIWESPNCHMQENFPWEFIDFGYFVFSLNFV